MDLKAPEQKPIAIHDYEFTFMGKPDLVISVFPSMGDTVRGDDDVWIFGFPRLNREQRVYRGPNLLTFAYAEHMRIYVDPKETIQKLLDERKKLQTKDTDGEDTKTPEVAHQ
jgi:hypothetical protein